MVSEGFTSMQLITQQEANNFTEKHRNVPSKITSAIQALGFIQNDK